MRKVLAAQQSENSTSVGNGNGATNLSADAESTDTAEPEAANRNHGGGSFWSCMKAAQDSAKRIRLTQTTDDTEAKIDAELAVYNAMDSLEIMSHETDHQHDVLEYWQKAGKNMPVLSVVARKFLAVTATSVASERLFSKTGYIISDRRALLKPNKVQDLTFLNCNWQL